MLLRQYVATSVLTVLLITDIFILSLGQFLNVPRRNPLEPLKNFQNTPRFRENAEIRNFPRNNRNYIQQNNLRFQRFNQRLLDRREAEGSDSDRRYATGSDDLSQYDNTGFCRDGWTEAAIDGVAICIRVNTEPSSWEDAQDRCRKDYSFLLKLEVPIRVQSKSIQDHLLSLGIKNVWTGLHSEHNHLVWDDISPSLVKTKAESDKSPWNWDENIAGEGDKLCGEIDIEDNSHIINTKRKRKRRAPVENRRQRQRQLLQQFQNVFQQTTPPNSKEVIDIVPPTDFSQLNAANRFRSMNNKRQMIQFANMRQSQMQQRHQTNRQKFDTISLQNNNYQSRKITSTKEVSHDTHVSLSSHPTNVRPVANERFVRLLNMLRAGSNTIKIEPAKTSSDINPANDHISQFSNMELTTVIPTDDDQPLDLSLESIQKLGEIFNKAKKNSKTSDDDDKKLKFDKVQEAIKTASADAEAKHNLKKENPSPIMETIFTSMDKISDKEQKNPLDLLHNTASLRIEKKTPSIVDILEKVIGDDKLKIENDNDNNKDIFKMDDLNINFQQNKPNNIDQNKKEIDKTKETSKLQKSTTPITKTGDIPTLVNNEKSVHNGNKIKASTSKTTNHKMNLPEVSKSINRKSDLTDDELPLPTETKPASSRNEPVLSGENRAHLKTRPVPPDRKTVNQNQQSLDTNTPLIGSGFLDTTIESGIIGDEGPMDNPKGNIIGTGLQIKDETEISNDKSLLQQLKSLKGLKVDSKPGDINIDKAIAEIDEVLALEENTKGHFVTLPPEPDVQQSVKHDINDDKKENRQKDKKESTVHGDDTTSMNELPPIKVDWPKPNLATKVAETETLESAKGNPKDENEVLLKVLEGIGSNTDVNAKESTSIQRLKENLESELKLSKIKTDTTELKSNSKIGPIQREHVDFKQADDNDISTSNAVGGLIIHPFEPESVVEVTTDGIDIKESGKKETILEENSDKIVTDSKDTGNVANILRVLDKMSEKRPDTASENIVLGSSIVQQMMTDDQSGTMIKHQARPVKTMVHDSDTFGQLDPQQILSSANDATADGENIEILQTTPGGIIINANFQGIEDEITDNKNVPFVDITEGSSLDGIIPLDKGNTPDDIIPVDTSNAPIIKSDELTEDTSLVTITDGSEIKDDPTKDHSAKLTDTDSSKAESTIATDTTDVSGSDAVVVTLDDQTSTDGDTSDIKSSTVEDKASVSKPDDTTAKSGTSVMEANDADLTVDDSTLTDLDTSDIKASTDKDKTSVSKAADTVLTDTTELLGSDIAVETIDDSTLIDVDTSDIEASTDEDKTSVSKADDTVSTDTTESLGSDIAVEIIDDSTLTDVDTSDIEASTVEDKTSAPKADDTKVTDDTSLSGTDDEVITGDDSTLTDIETSDIGSSTAGDKTSVSKADDTIAKDANDLLDTDDAVVTVDDSALTDIDTSVSVDLSTLEGKDRPAIDDEPAVSKTDTDVSVEVTKLLSDDSVVPIAEPVALETDAISTTSDSDLNEDNTYVDKPAIELKDDKTIELEKIEDTLLENINNDDSKVETVDISIPIAEEKIKAENDMADDMSENIPVDASDDTDEIVAISSSPETINDFSNDSTTQTIEDIPEVETGDKSINSQIDNGEMQEEITEDIDTNIDTLDIVDKMEDLIPGGDSVADVSDVIMDGTDNNEVMESIADDIFDSNNDVVESNTVDNDTEDISKLPKMDEVQDVENYVQSNEIENEFVEEIKDLIDDSQVDEDIREDSTVYSTIDNITATDSEEADLNITDTFENGNIDSDNEIIDIANYASDEFDVDGTWNETDETSTNEQLYKKDQSQVIENFDGDVDESENVGKEIVSDDLDNTVNDYMADEELKDSIEGNSSSLSNEDSVENITNVFDSSEDILVSEAAAVEDPVHQTEVQDLDVLEEEAEEFVPPEDIVEHIPQQEEGAKNSEIDLKKLIMRLGGCEKPKPSVCFSHPVKVDTQVSMCGNGWYGHVFVNKCYRYIPQAMSYTFARNVCVEKGGQLSMVDSAFLRKFILTSVTLARYNANTPRNVISVWIHTEPDSSSCRLLSSSMGIQNVNCLTLAEAVCERPKQQLSTLNGQDHSENHDIEFVQPEVKQFPKDDVSSKLECSIDTVAPELPVMWYKDGVPVAAKITQMSQSLILPPDTSYIDKNTRIKYLLGNSTCISYLTRGLRQGYLTRLKIDITLSSDLYLRDDFVKEVSSRRNGTIEMLQGRYWCETWTVNPFQRTESKPTLIRFSDVMAFVGRVDIHQVPLFEYTLHNMINEPFNGIQKLINDLQVIYDRIVPDLQAVVPEVLKIQINPDTIERGPIYRLKFYTYVTMSTTYSMVTERSVNLLMRRELRERLQNTTFVLSLPGKTPIHLVRSLQFFSTVACPMDRLKDKDTSLTATFPSSATGLEVTSIEACEGEVAGKAKCDGDYATGAFWNDVRVFKNCNDNSDSSDESEDTGESSESSDDSTVMGHISVEDRLKELAEVDVEDDNVDAIMDETADILEHIQEMTAEYVDYVAEIVDKTAHLDHTTKETSENLVKTVDKILDIDDDELKKTKKANSIIRSLEKVAENMALDVYGKFRIVTPNVALEVWDLKHQSLPVIGLAAKDDTKTNSFEEKQIVTLYNRSQVYVDDINAAIELPADLVYEVMTGKESRLYMMVYRHGRLFQTMSEAQTKLEENKEAQFIDDSGLLNSFVISASIGGKKIEHLKNRVKAIFKPLKDVKGKEKTCAHWDFTLNNNRGGWSARGCIYNGTVNGRDICLCDHLTNFAVLIDFYGQSEPIPEHHEISLSIISLIGLSLSILGLSLTIISYAFFKKLRRGRAQQTLFNLALSMLCSWIVFLTGIKQTHSYYGCFIVAALLHYFILSSFMWMLMEAFLQYLTFVKVLGTYVTRYTLKTVLIAWGLPLIPVICVLSIDYTLYSGGSRYCWMSLTAFYYSFAIPVGLIILCNLIVFVITVISICRRPNGLRSNQSKSKMAMANLQAAITSFVLLGLTWFLGYLAISDARLPFQYAFTILNSLQGFFIFILFVLRKKRVRDQWLILCCCKNPEQEKALRSLSASGSIPSTGSGRSSYSGRSERSDSTRTTTSFVNDSYDSLFFPYKSSRTSLYYREKSNSVTSE